MFKRYLEDKLQLSQMPVIFINGARQVGKSTLVKKVFATTHDYFTLDDPQILSTVKKDPLNFVRYAKNSLVVDEVQRCPELLLAIKTVVDEKRIPRQFILTGSVNVLQLKSVKDSLAGRMAMYTLWPLSQEEINGQQSDFLSDLFKGHLANKSVSDFDMLTLLQKGGYPLSVLAPDDYARKEWLHAYLNQIMEKDIRDLSNIEGLREMPGILDLLASRVGSLLNVSDLSRSLQISHTTLKRYLILLQMTYLFCPMQPWFKNFGKRLTKSEKVFLIDTALIELMFGKNLQSDSLLYGHALENYIGMEIIKQLSYKQITAKIFHYRTIAGEEVDFVLEDTAGNVVGIEVKSATQISDKNIKALRLLKEQAKDKFKIGIVLYQGSQIFPLFDGIYAVPMAYLFSNSQTSQELQLKIWTL